MRRLLLAITICFITVTMVTQSILAYQLNSFVAFIAEEEPHEEKPVKTLKKDLKESLLHQHSLLSAANGHKLLLYISQHQFLFSKGYSEIPYTPPDHS